MKFRNGHSPNRRQQAEAAGRSAERLACLFLRLKLFSIQALRWRCKTGEIDIIAKRGNLLVFVEVKRRKSLEEGISAVTPKAEQRIIRAAEIYLAQPSIHHEVEKLDIRFDVIAVSGVTLNHHRDAFRPH